MKGFLNLTKKKVGLVKGKATKNSRLGPVPVEEALRRQADLLQKTFDSMTDAIFVLDAKIPPTILECNETAAQMFGYAKAEMLGKTTGFFHVSEEALRKFQSQLYSAVEQNRLPFHLPENAMRRKDGTVFPSEHFVSQLVDDKGVRSGWVSIVRDITERKRMELTLSRRAEELEALHATVLEITRQQELPTLLNDIVERAAHLLGAPSGGMYMCDPERKEVRCMVSYNTPKDYAGTVLSYGEGAAGLVAKTGEPLVVEDYRNWSGRAAVFERDQPFTALLSAPLIWQGRVTGVIHVLEDKESRRFTESDLKLLSLFANHAAIAIENARHSENLEQKVAERTAKLAESENQLRLMADSLPALISYVDSEHRYRFNNKAYEEWFGQPRSEILGRHVREVLGEPTYQRIRRHVEATLSGETRSYEDELPYRSGGTRYVRATYVPDFGEHGQVKGMFALVSDITEHKRMEERLLKTERLAGIGETAAMVGHDLRNPLQGIGAAAYALRERLGSRIDEKTRELIRLIETGVEYSDRIIQDLLDYSGEIQLQLQVTTPRSIARDALQQIKMPDNVRVSDLTTDEPKLEVDPAKMQRVFTNIIENAIHAMPTGGEITVSSKKSNSAVEFRFTDTGPGIPEEMMQELWRPLVTTKAKGMGLGLAICRRIVEAHDGSISVETTVGHGTTFMLTLPIKPEVKKG